MRWRQLKYEMIARRGEYEEQSEMETIYKGDESMTTYLSTQVK